MEELSAQEEAEEGEGGGMGSAGGRRLRRKAVNWTSPDGTQRRVGILETMATESGCNAGMFGGRLGIRDELVKRARLHNQTAGDPACGPVESRLLIDEGSLGNPSAEARKWDLVVKQRRQMGSNGAGSAPVGSVKGAAHRPAPAPRAARASQQHRQEDSTSREGSLPPVQPSSNGPASQQGGASIEAAGNQPGGCDLQQQYQGLYAFRSRQVPTVINSYMSRFATGSIAVVTVSPHGSVNVDVQGG